MTQKFRLNKYIALCGLGSRRNADELIKSGKVEVNGEKIDSPAVTVTKKDIVKISGKVIKPEKKEYIIFNKPPGYITTAKDEKNRKTIYNIIPEKMKNLKSAGRLDRESSGLLIMTNDGELIQKLTHPKMQVPKVYRVTARGKFTAQDLEKLRNGIEIEKGKIAYADAIVLDYSNSVTTLEITLFQGYNRQIRKMLEKIDHPVISLKRIAHACIVMGSLDRGKFRYLKPKEVEGLYNYLKKLNK